MSCGSIIHFKEGQGEGTEQVDLTGVFALHPQTCDMGDLTSLDSVHRSTAQAVTPTAPLEPRALPATSQKQYTRDTKPAAHARRTLGVPHLRLEALVS